MGTKLVKTAQPIEETEMIETPELPEAPPDRRTSRTRRISKAIGLWVLTGLKAEARKLGRPPVLAILLFLCLGYWTVVHQLTLHMAEWWLGSTAFVWVYVRHRQRVVIRKENRADQYRAWIDSPEAKKRRSQWRRWPLRNVVPLLMFVLRGGLIGYVWWAFSVKVMISGVGNMFSPTLVVGFFIVFWVIQNHRGSICWAGFTIHVDCNHQTYKALDKALDQGLDLKDYSPIGGNSNVENRRKVAKWEKMWHFNGMCRKRHHARIDHSKFWKMLHGPLTRPGANLVFTVTCAVRQSIVLSGLGMVAVFIGTRAIEMYR